MTKQERMEKAIAKMRELEIRRKSKKLDLQCSGYIPSQLGHLTKAEKLVSKGHFRLEGKAATISHKRDEVARKKAELKALEGKKHKLVKKENGLTVRVENVITK